MGTQVRWHQDMSCAEKGKHVNYHKTWGMSTSTMGMDEVVCKQNLIGNWEDGCERIYVAYFRVMAKIGEAQARKVKQKAGMNKGPPVYRNSNTRWPVKSGKDRSYRRRGVRTKAMTPFSSSTSDISPSSSSVSAVVTATGVHTTFVASPEGTPVHARVPS